MTSDISPDAGAQPGARALASRRNGARSRGPRTAAGKARSSANALKHGLRARRQVLLVDEDAAEYRAFQAAAQVELAPMGARRSGATLVVAPGSQARRASSRRASSPPPGARGAPTASRRPCSAIISAPPLSTPATPRKRSASS